VRYARYRPTKTIMGAALQHRGAREELRMNLSLQDEFPMKGVRGLTGKSLTGQNAQEPNTSNKKCQHRIYGQASNLKLQIPAH
jgi:hypothetical protein